MHTRTFSFGRSARSRLALHAALACLVGGLTLFLSACGGDVREEVTIRPGERWKVEARFALSPDELMLIGDTAEIDARLDEQGNDPEAAATNYTWSKEPTDDGGVVYIVEYSGKGLQSLNSAAFDDLATFSPMTYGDKDAIYFAFNPSGSFGDVAYYELVLHTGEVFDTNGELLDEGVVRWVGAYQNMEAVVRLSKGIDPLWIAGLAALIIAIAAATLLIRRRQQEQHVQAIMATSAYCDQCGARMEIAGRFCPSCGAPRL